MTQSTTQGPKQPVPPDIPVEPFAHGELAATLRHPYRLLDVVLGERRRLAANLRGGVAIPALIGAVLEKDRHPVE